MVRRVCLLVALLWTGLLSAGPVPLEEICRAGDAYFAPKCSAGYWRMRLPDGSVREFDYDRGKTNRMSSVDGWRAVVSGDKVVVTPPKGAPLQMQWHFARGRAIAVKANGNLYEIEYDRPVTYPNRSIVRLWPTAEEISAHLNLFRSNWGQDGRLRLWFDSPNQAGAFIVICALISLAAFCRARRKIVQVGWALLLLVLTWLLVWTASRGSMVALVAGSLPILACRFMRDANGRFRLGRRMALVTFVFLCVVALAFGLVKCRRISRTVSDQTRIHLFEKAARMLADAPGGYGSAIGVGRAFSYWYADGQDAGALRCNLICDHLTQVVSGGVWRGGAYVFAWATGLTLLLLFAWYGRFALPAALWLALGVAASFNVILPIGQLWLSPVASLALLALERPWRFPRRIMVAGLVGLAAAVAVIGSLLFAASRQKRQWPSVCREGNRVMIGGRSPTHWLVDDLNTLGLVSSGYDIRAAFAADRNTPALGYVRRLADLPDFAAIRLLALPGEMGRKFLDEIARSGVPNVLPESILFLSPPFSPSAVPATLREKARVRYVIGEFAARYDPESTDYPSWVEVIPSAELYIPTWTRFVMGTY